MQLEELKKRLWIADNSQDEKLQAMLEDGVRMLEHQLGYKITPHEKTEWRKVENSLIVFLSAPILSITSAEGIEIKRREKNRLYLAKKVKGEVKIVYQAWFNQIPETLNTALFEWVKEALRLEKVWDELEISSKQIDTLRISYFNRTESEKASIVKQLNKRDQLLRPYKLLSLGKI